MLEQLFTSALVYATGMTILHSLWQATLLAVVLWLLSRYTELRANGRYRLAFGMLFVQLVLSAFTFWLYYDPVVRGLNVVIVAITETLSGQSQVVATSSDLLTSSEFWLVVLVGCWFLGMAVGLLKLLISYGRVRGVQRKSQKNIPASFSARVAELADRLGYQGKLRLGLSDMLDGPALVGHLKPVLLFPLAMVNQLTTEEAETVILHELAHLQRNDHWWNLVQCAIEVLFYYHPAIHWISARIREEREHCCDDLVLSYGPGRLPYARALLRFEEQRSTELPTALSLTDGGGLLARIQRFITNQEITYQMKSRLLLLPLLALITLIGTAAYAPATPEVEAPAPAAPAIEAVSTVQPVAIIDEVPAPDFAPFPMTLVPAAPAPDTLPAGTHQVTSIVNGKTTKLRVEDGEIKELEIEGRVVPPSEYEQHEEFAEKMLGGSSRSRSYGNAHGHGSFRDLEDFEFFDGEEFGEHFEKMGEMLGRMGERLGESMENFFQFNGEFNGIDTSFSFYFDDNEWRDGILDSMLQERFSEEDFPRRRFEGERSRDRIYTEQELLRELEQKERALEQAQRSMEQQLERSKQQLEETRQQLKQERQESEENANQQELRLQNEQRLAEIRANNEERRAALAEARGGKDFVSVVEQLQKEGLLDRGEIETIELDDDKVMVNGKSYGKKVHKRFLDVFEERYGRRPSGKFTVSFRR